MSGTVVEYEEKIVARRMIIRILPSWSVGEIQEYFGCSEPCAKLAKDIEEAEERRRIEEERRRIEEEQRRIEEAEERRRIAEAEERRRIEEEQRRIEEAEERRKDRELQLAKIQAGTNCYRNLLYWLF